VTRKQKFRHLIAFALLAALTAGCASVPGEKPQTEAKHSGAMLDTEAKLSDANSALDSANERSAAFYAQLAPVLEEIKQFCSRPGWIEFEQILLEFPSLRDTDIQIEITPEIESRLDEWGRRWNTSWEDTLIGYHDLVDKCIILEAKKLSVRERLLAVQAKYLAAVMIELSAGREQRGREIYSVIELLDKSVEELNSYQADDLGLYRFK
jgi:hypothetical protein